MNFLINEKFVSVFFEISKHPLRKLYNMIISKTNSKEQR